MPRTAARATPSAVEPAAESADCCAPCVESPLTEDGAARYATVLKALADPHRLRMVSLLAAQPADEPMCVCDVESCFDLSQPTVSHHLKVLREAGIVGSERQGLWAYYYVTPDSLKELSAWLS
jgi:ArsR family transcriptional regulator